MTESDNKPKGDATLGEQESYAHVPGVARSHDRTKPRYVDESIDVAGGACRLYIMQPEQVVSNRLRLIGCGWKSAAQITLPAADSIEYTRKRAVLLKLLQGCCRRTEGRPSLVFPGDDGYAKLAKIDDGHLVRLARKVVEFGEFFGEPDAQ